MAEIIAEFCQNHCGDLKVLARMVQEAAESGADYGKIQSMLAQNLAYRERFESGLIEDGVARVIKRPYAAEFERLRHLDLDDDAHKWFIDECVKCGIRPLTTVFDRSRVEFLASLDWPERVIKIASFDCSSHDLLRDLIAAGFEKFFISTGGTYDHEIEDTAELLRSAGVEFVFFHCVSLYPTPLAQAHLARLDYLRTLSTRVGFSEHSCPEVDGLKMSIAALHRRADIIERHFTVLPKDRTRDGIVSLNAAQLADLVRFARLPRPELATYVSAHLPEYRQMVGSAQRTLSEAELLNRDYYRGRFSDNVTV